jgi:starvation-inducible DNA-binding protein
MKTNNSKLVERLNQLLADYQIYYQNLRGLHWNVKGAQFFMLHEKYEELYNEAAESVDEIAERILMVGGQPLHTFTDYLKVAELKDAGLISEGKKGVEVVLENSRYLLKSFNEILELADGDEGTYALMSDLIGATEKRIWMLESTLG